MQISEVVWVKADGNSWPLAVTGAKGLIEAFRDLPWAGEWQQAESDTGAFPTLAITAGSKGRDGYLTITTVAASTFLVQVAARVTTDRWWLFAGQRRYERDFEPLSAAEVEEWIHRFDASSPQELATRLQRATD